jgi:hypothetical protein
MVQRASWEMSMSDSVLDERPTIMVRLVDDTGCSICGGFATPGRATAAWAMRSWTTCRAR